MTGAIGHSRGIYLLDGKSVSSGVTGAIGHSRGRDLANHGVNLVTGHRPLCGVASCPDPQKNGFFRVTRVVAGSRGI